MVEKVHLAYTQSKMSEEDMIHFEDWEKIDLRVGKILKVDNHPNADKLYVLKVDLGETKPRTIVAGLKNYCSPKELEGKSAIFVSNLKPVNIRGVESQGMILAAVSGDKSHACILTPDIESEDEELEAGTKIS